MEKVPLLLLFAVFSAGGTAGAVVTCPLEVVKTRLQSSSGTTLNRLYLNPTQLHLPFQASVAQIHICASCNSNFPVNRPLPAVLHHGGSKTAGIIFCLRWAAWMIWTQFSGGCSTDWGAVWSDATEGLFG